MHNRKQRSLTPGPTPLYPPALHAMMAFENFRKVHRACRGDLTQAIILKPNGLPVLYGSGVAAVQEIYLQAQNA
jgi:aspartate aminotransferase-like enzyme